MFAEILHLCELMIERLVFQSWFTQLFGIYLLMCLFGLVFVRLFGVGK